jgi:hypothetical protein
VPEGNLAFIGAVVCTQHRFHDLFSLPSLSCVLRSNSEPMGGHY